MDETLGPAPGNVKTPIVAVIAHESLGLSAVGPADQSAEMGWNINGIYEKVAVDHNVPIRVSRCASLRR